MFPIRIDDHLRTARNRRSKILYQGDRSEDPHQAITSTPSSGRVIISSRTCLSLGITCTLIITQLLLTHYIIGLTSNRKLFSFYNSGNDQADQDWNCIWPGLGEIHDLANRFGIDLVVVDPDLLRSLERDLIDPQVDHDNVEVNFSPSKQYQESTDKSIIHFAAINETSGGQPNLKLFYNALKNNGYTVLKYLDTSQLMQPEVYRRPSHLFDDMPLDGVRWHKFSHDSTFLHEESVKSHDEYNSEDVSHEVELSKIYTEFISHIFILNTTQTEDERWNRCKSRGNGSKSLTVVHILVLYNYEYSPSSRWIQSSLLMNEIDKHKLLSYGVHSFDFKIPIEETYIHEKRDIVSITKPGGPSDRKKRSSEDLIRVFEPEGDRFLTFVNNSYIFCQPSQFNISGLIDGTKRLSNYLLELDITRPITVLEDDEFVQGQLGTALRFMDTYSRAYGNFSYWITGASLLAYYKHCSLAVMPRSSSEIKLNFFDRQNQASGYSSVNYIINLELGLFSSEVNESVLSDLASAEGIGVIMMSDWRKTNSPITFQFRDCPNIMFNLHLYELRRDFYQHYFITQSTMTGIHKFNKKQKIDSSRNHSYGHHVFDTNNLNLCWTRTDDLSPFRIPCNVHDHLRRIYII